LKKAQTDLYRGIGNVMEAILKIYNLTSSAGANGQDDLPVVCDHHDLRVVRTCLPIRFSRLVFCTAHGAVTATPYLEIGSFSHEEEIVSCSVLPHLRI
jgi:hypothetical protein